MISAWLFLPAVLVLYLLASIKILSEYERGVVFRLGRVLPEAKGPGIVLVFAPIGHFQRLDAQRHPHGEGERGDLLPRNRSAPGRARGLQLPIRDVASGADHTSERSGRGGTGRTTEPAGQTEPALAVHPGSAHRVAIARQAEAERERRAKVIHAEGEFVAAEKLAMAAAVIQRQPAAIQLRYLQTLVEIGAEHNTTIVFPLPVDLITSIMHVLNGAQKTGVAGRPDGQVTSGPNGSTKER